MALFAKTLPWLRLTAVGIINLTNNKQILPLFHKSVQICLCDPLTVSDLFFVFFCCSGVFWAKTTLFFFSLCLNHAAGRPEKIESAPKQPYFAPFTGERKCRKKKKKKKSRISRPRCKYHSMPSRHKPSLKLPYRILPPSPKSIVLWCLWARFGVVITTSHNNYRKNYHKHSHKYSQKCAKMGIFWLEFSVEDHLRLFFFF